MDLRHQAVVDEMNRKSEIWLSSADRKARRVLAVLAVIVLAVCVWSLR